MRTFLIEWSHALEERVGNRMWGTADQRINRQKIC